MLRCKFGDIDHRSTKNEDQGCDHEQGPEEPFCKSDKSTQLFAEISNLFLYFVSPPLLLPLMFVKRIGEAPLGRIDP
ncbi:conserved hypothetical protein (plasmid) [Salinibacter ruber M8]|uniref:Uncharacterized protein n=1 Tax=Salinibacter ruber (strain M8) TaxID=761659 RepID=D5H495_SALRM|nr:conserved hypothetical protein [Salinibacter ruber M8]